jgi:ABC-type Na+ efflux pump permease subunit
MMLAIVGALYGLVVGLVLFTLALVSIVSAEGQMANLDATLMGIMSAEDFVAMATGGTIKAYNFLIYSQFLGIAAVLAGHSVLHDRQCGTLTFLLLAPVRRTELLTGKVLGAIGPSCALYLLISGGASLLMCTFEVAQPYATHLPNNPAWWVAFLTGGPTWALFIGSICTIVSSLSHDVRTAQQGVWFVVFFGTMFCGALLTYALEYGVIAQFGVTLVAVIGSAITQMIGANLMQRDLSR